MNLPEEVITIGVALVAVAPERGGILAPPLSIEALGDAIEQFQRFQSLPYLDGRVDPNGRTLRRINEILFPGDTPAAGAVRPLDASAAMATTVTSDTWSPVEASLIRDYIFEWTKVSGSGRILYFQLDEFVAPRWFGVLVPEGDNDFDRVHIFFHPTPAQAGYSDANYHSLGDWTNIFHYLHEDMGAQFCAAGTGRVLLMPLMTEASASDCGIFPQRWESITSRILGMLKTGDFSASTPPAIVNSVVISSFSSGIVFSHQFRQRANLNTRLKGVIDFDGIISSYSPLSAVLSGPPGHVIRMQQMLALPPMIEGLATQNIFPLSRPRWGEPWTNSFDPNPQQALLQIHGTIPQTMMYLAARRAG